MKRDNNKKPSQTDGGKRSFQNDRKVEKKREFTFDKEVKKDKPRTGSEKSFSKGNSFSGKRDFGKARGTGSERFDKKSEGKRAYGSDKPFKSRNSDTSDRFERPSDTKNTFSSGKTYSERRAEGGERNAKPTDFKKSGYGDKKHGGESYGGKRKFERDSDTRNEERPRKSYDKRDSDGAKGYEKKPGSYSSDRSPSYRKSERPENSKWKKSERKPDPSANKPYNKDATENPAWFRNKWDDSKPETNSESTESKTVYKGRGKDERPIFETVTKNDAGSNSPAKKRFKNPFAGAPMEERPSYNFEKVDKSYKKNEDTDTLRLNKYISNSGVCSRREADVLIQKGEVQVNGEVVTELGYKVQRKDRVVYKGKPINPEKPVYILLNKPKDFITTTEDPEDRKTVMHLIRNACEERVFPVGRLDRNTTGLLLFTNDGELAAKLSHPSNNIKKIYQVTLDKLITKGDEEAIIAGITLEDGPVTVDDMQVLSKDRTIIGLEIHAGRNRIVRRIFAHLGYEVVALDRVIYAGLDKKDLPRGRFRFLSEKEVVRLKYF